MKPNSKVFTALAPGGPGAGHEPDSIAGGAAWVQQLPAVLARWERQRKVGQSFRCGRNIFQAQNEAVPY